MTLSHFIWKLMLCFLGILFSLWQAHSRFPDFYPFTDMIKHNVKGKNRLSWEKNWDWCLLIISVMHINSGLQNTGFTCLALVIPAQLVSLCLNTVFLLLRHLEDSFLPCHSLGPSECPSVCLFIFCKPLHARSHLHLLLPLKP